MIVFDLGCENNHRFEGWFGSNEDFERQSAGRLVTCPLCGNANVARLPHAPHIGSSGRERPAPVGVQAAQQYANVGKDALAKMIAQVLESTEDVGAAFPEEARKIHYQEVPERCIRGTASREEVESLKDEGIEVVALAIPADRPGKMH